MAICLRSDRKRDISDIMAVNQYTAFADNHKTRDQIDKRFFPPPLIPTNATTSPALMEIFNIFQ